MKTNLILIIISSLRCQSISAHIMYSLGIGRVNVPPLTNKVINLYIDYILDTISSVYYWRNSIARFRGDNSDQWSRNMRATSAHAMCRHRRTGCEHATHLYRAYASKPANTIRFCFDIVTHLKLILFALYL